MRVVYQEAEIGGISHKTIQVLLPIYIVVGLSYLAWRIHNFTQWHIWYAPLLLAAEIYGILFTFTYLLVSRKTMQPVWWPPIPDASVDVFITTYNEPENIVKMTTVGALNIRGIRHVFVLDDGNRKSIRRMVEKLGAKYVARTVNTHAKAGNMNNGIKHSDAEFMIFLDCDHVPQPQFLERTLGYFRDPSIAFVQTPQTFYNPSSIQFRKLRSRNFWNEQSMFYESIQPGKNAFNAAFFCGSSAMLRRSAIDSVGGFATGTATEDIHTSLRLHAKGWSSVFLNEQLAHGLANEDISEYHKQRVRWGAGSLGLLFRSPDSPFRARGLSFMQRLCYLHSTISFLNGIQRLFYILLPAMLLILMPLEKLTPGAPIIRYTMVALPFVVFSYVITHIFSRRTFRLSYMEQFNIINIFSNFLSIKGIIKVQKKFKVSLKFRVFVQESSPQRALLLMWGVSFLAAVIGPAYWFIYWQNSLASLLRTTIAVSMLWNLVNLYFLSRVVWYVNFKNLSPADSHTLNVHAIKRYIWAKGHKLRLEKISLKGAEIFSRSKIRGDIKLELSKDLHLKAKITENKAEKNGYRLLVEFYPLTLRGDSLLTLYMFHDLVPKLLATDVIKKKTHQRTRLFVPLPTFDTAREYS